jgi:gluconolactonase
MIGTNNMRRLFLFHVVVLTITLQLASVLIAGQESATYGKIARLGPRFDKLVPQDAVLEKIADGFGWVEGPVWDRKGNYLLFSDIPNNSIFKWEEGKGISLS